jgi:hypothetical protein
MNYNTAFYLALLNLTARYLFGTETARYLSGTDQTPIYIISINGTVTYDIYKHARVHQFRKS